MREKQAKIRYPFSPCSYQQKLFLLQIPENFFIIIIKETTTTSSKNENLTFIIMNRQGQPMDALAYFEPLTSRGTLSVFAGPELNNSP